MKSLLIAVTLFFTVLTTSSLAADKTVNPVVLKSFNNTFTSAKDVAWTITESFFKAQFQLNGQYITAFYLSDGSMVGLSRNITVAQLPITLQADLKKSYNDYWVSDLFEVTTEGSTEYYITL
ncbi:MAG TPA: hypothetical protein VM888_04170, partial [Chitinophagaceae bacterium]|nr:hypothetical protein [Chitinophagaceae bacterium]